MDEFIKGFIKLGDQMCELNYKGTKIEIGVKLGTKSAILPKKMKPLQGITLTLTRGIDTWQSTSEVNGQHPNRACRTNFVGIYKTGDQICELNYRGIKFEIGDKLVDQKCNFAYFIHKAQTR